MDKGLVTVIVPVYNAERYLDRCIHSITNQTYKNLEIILIDDGSQDKSSQMCDTWAKKDSRICVIHKVNEGQGVARNLGIERASGAYILFVDSDDYLDLDTVECSYSEAIASGADMVCFGLYAEDASGKTTAMRIPKPPKKVYRGEEVTEIFLPEMIEKDPKTGRNWNIPLSGCARLYSFQCIKKGNWRFVSEKKIICEDHYSVIDFCRHVKCVSVLQRACYHYCENTNSFSREYRADRFEKLCHFYQEVLKLIDECGYPEIAKSRIDVVFLNGVIAVLKQLTVAELTQKNKIAEVESILNSAVLQQVLEVHKRDRESWKKKIFFFVMRRQMAGLSYFIAKLRNIRGIL